jgi:hypothetical protein
MRKTVRVFTTCASGAMAAFAALVFALASPAWQAQAQTQYSAPSWTGGDAYQAILNWNNYFYSGQYSTASSSLDLYPGEASYNNTTGNGENFGIIYDNDPPAAPSSYPPSSPSLAYWETFWTEAEAIEVVEDAYWWAADTKGSPSKYLTEVNNLAEGFIDLQYPTTNFCKNNTPWTSGDSANAYCWHGANYASMWYDSPEGSGKGNGGDWFNDDLMWASMAFARAWRITYNADPSAPVSGWLTAAQNQVDYVWANAQAQTNAANGATNGTEVGLLQAFCNTNKASDGGPDGDVPGETCVQSYGTNYTGWRPNLDAEVNFSFVNAAMMVGDDLTLTGDATDAQTYYNEAAAVYAWAKENLISTAFSDAQTCTSTMTSLYNSNTTFQGLSTNQTCAEVYDSNSIGTIGGQSVGFNGEDGYWNWLSSTPPSQGTGDYSMNYGNAIQAAIRMGDTTTAQEIANYLMYGLDQNGETHGYVGNYEYSNTDIPYYVLPNYGQGGNYSGSNGIALRGIAYGLFQYDANSSLTQNMSSHAYLDKLALNWAQANMQAAWDNKANDEDVMWNDWTPGDTTPNLGGSYNYSSWDCGDAAVGMLTIGTAATPPGGN